MAETISTVAAPAAAPAAAGKQPGNSGPDFIRIEGQLGKVDLGDDFEDPNPVDSGKAGTETVEGLKGPVSGQPGDPSKQDQLPPKEKDPVDSELDYYNELEIKPETPNPDPQLQSGTQTPITDFLKANDQKLTEALKAAGMPEQLIAELKNAPILAGRHGAELGQLRKDNQQFQQMAQWVSPVLDYRDGKPVGIDGIKVLQAISSQEGGPQVVQERLAEVGLKLVPVNWQGTGATGNTQARTSIAAEIAKEFNIDSEGLTPSELRAAIHENVDADDAFNAKMRQWESQEANKSRMTEAQRQQQMAAQDRLTQEEVTKTAQLLEDFKKKIPHFDAVEPVMTKLYQDIFSKGPPSMSQLTEILRHAAENMTAGPRVKKMFEAGRKRGYLDALKKLNIPESDAPFEVVPSRQPGAPEPETPAATNKHGGFVPEFA